MTTPHPLAYNVDMHYLYLLRSKESEKVYIGTTSDLKARLFAHNSGQNKSTKLGQPWELIYYEAYLTLSLARLRERQLKRFCKIVFYAKEKNRLVS